MKGRYIPVVVFALAGLVLLCLRPPGSLILQPRKKRCKPPLRPFIIGLP